MSSILRVTFAGSLIFFFLCFEGCKPGTSTGSDDNSVSGIAAGILGGIVNSSSASGTQAAGLLKPEIPRRVACPTMSTALGDGCAESGTNYTMTYADCTFGDSTATWLGSQIVSLASGTATCGVFPDTTFTRTFGSGTTRTSSADIAVTLDTSINPTNFESLSVGGGMVVTFTTGLRTQLDINGIHLTSSLFDHTIYTASSLTMDDTTPNKTINGSIILLHNLLKIRATSTFSNVTYAGGCCFPTNGNISTYFDAGTTGGDGSSIYIGQTETMTFTSTCGQATFTNIKGITSIVTLTHCL